MHATRAIVELETMSSDTAMMPDDEEIEQTLRRVVQSLPSEGLSVNVARTATEEELGLDPGFLKSDEWKARSKQIITDAVMGEPSPQKPKSAPPKPSKAKKAAAKKRSSTETASNPKKRQKRAVSESSPLSEEAEGEEGEEEEGEEEAAKGEEAEEVEPTTGVEEKKAANEDSESELSEVLDEPPPKRKPKKSTGAESKAKRKPAKGSSSAAKDVSPDEAEIKRLQGWLVKCGMRKVWGRYLAPYETPKAKIKHLKDMLKDAGMDGRYSNEKASSIKEQRELDADLEAVQEGARIWGHDEEEEEEEGEKDAGTDTKPKRRAAAAARFVDFGDSEEESE